jgi:VWFA-related protein
VAVISFTHEATLEQNLTNDLAALRSAIERLRVTAPPGYRSGGIVVGARLPSSSGPQDLAGSTAIWDAIWATTNGILKSTAGSRLAIVIITDGEDTSSTRKLAQVIEFSARNDVAVFAIGIGNEYFGGPDRDSLKRLTEGTGGRAFFPKKKAKELSDILGQIDQELGSRYLLTYCANAESKPSKINIQFTNKQPQESGQLFYRRYGF